MARLRHVLPSLALALVVVVVAVPSKSPGQDSLPVAPKAAAKVETKTAPAKSAGGTAGVTRESITRLLTSVNPMIWLLGLCSIVTLGFGLERVIALRRGRVIPKDFVSRFHERLAGGKLDRDRAIELCRANDSPMARVFVHVVRYWGQPAAVIRQAVEADAAGEVVDLKRNVRVLNATSTIAPLLGLLGTVIGMIESFEALGSKAGKAKSEALAQGISLALVSTAIGLGIAIVSVTLYYYLLGRVDNLVKDLDEQARRAIDLVSAEAIRPGGDRRAPGYAGDHTRHESRIH
jgi:biopolymer transport protein ExbB